MPKLHGVNASPFVRKVRVALIEKGIDYELEPVMPIGVSEEFKRISPLGKIPVFQDGDYTLPDSSCIIAYLERVHPTPALYPGDDRELGTALFFEEYGDTRLVDALTTVFSQRIVVGRIMKGTPDETVIARQIEEVIPPILDYLEGVAPDGDGLVGGRFSIADIGVVSPFVNYEHAGERVDAKRWPRLATYIDRVCARPSFEQLIEEEKAALAAIG